MRRERPPRGARRPFPSPAPRPAVPAIAAAAILVMLAAPALGAQSWRTLTARRQLVRADTLHVRVPYGAGTFAFGTAPAGLLYDLRIRYDAARFRPRRAWDGATHTLVVGADSATARKYSLDPRAVHLSGDVGGEHASELNLRVAPGIPLDLALELGVAEANIDLTGLTLAKLRLESAATESKLTFGAPNPTPIPELEIRSSAAGLTVRQLGNARAALVRVTTTVGGTDLDLGGAWTGETTLNLHLVLGGATVRVPRDVGVQVRLSKVLGDFTAPGLTRRDGTWYSANWASARRRLTIDADVVMGGVEVVREE
ncbi:MAG TPA: LiaF domain-containing protein [Gemmatimonadaceae bacterium]